jgi:hypothetical protein
MTNTIQTANGKSLSYNDILKRQEKVRRKRNKQRKNDKWYNQYTLINQGNLPEMSFHEIADNVSNKVSVLQLQLQRSAREIAQCMVGSTPLEYEKALKSYAQEWVEQHSSEIENDIVGPVLANSIKTRERSEHARRRQQWIDDNVNNSAKPPVEFYCIVKMPQIGLDFDTRKRMHVYDRKLKRPVRKPQRAVWDSPGSTRHSVITKMLMAADMYPYREDEQEEQQARKTALKELLQQHEAELHITFIKVPNVHDKSLGSEFDAMFFSLIPTKNSPTHYAYDTEGGLYKCADEDIVIHRDVVVDDTEVSPISLYELEDLIIKGRTDDIEMMNNDSLEQGWTSQMAGESRSVDYNDLPAGVDAYVTLAFELGREDLVQLATDPECPECPMTPDIAQAVWDGMMQPVDASELWGDIYTYTDKDGNKTRKRAAWLREAMDVLVNENMLESFANETAEHAAFMNQVEHLIMHFGSIALTNVKRTKLRYGSICLVDLHGSKVEITHDTDPEIIHQVKHDLGLKAFKKRH